MGTDVLVLEDIGCYQIGIFASEIIHYRVEIGRTRSFSSVKFPF